MLNKNLVKETQKNNLFLFLSVLMGIGVAVAVIIQAGLVSKIISFVFLDQYTLAEAKSEILALVAVIIIRALLLLFREMAAGEVSARVMYSLRNELFSKIIGFGPVRMGNERTGELTNVIFQGVERLDKYFREYLPQLILAAVIPLIVLFVVFPIDVLTGIIFLVTAPLIPIFMILIGKQAESETKRQWKLLSNLSGYYFDILKGLETLKNFGQSQQKKYQIRDKSEQYAAVTLRVLRIAFLSALVLEMLATISTAVVAVQIGLRLMYGRMSFADGLFLLILAPEYYFPLRQLGAGFHSGKDGVAASERIYSILDGGYDDEYANEIILEEGLQFNQSIEFCNVSFQYEERECPSVLDLNFRIEKGTHTALVGSSGSGKSTVISLLMGFMFPKEGEIRIDGVVLSPSKMQAWREKIAYIPQLPYLFSGTAEDNLRIAKKDAALLEMKQATKLANADEFIERLPDKYHTSIGEDGAKISRGQAQRLALARAYLRNAPFVVIDEPSASLDPRNDERLRQVLKRLVQKSTVLTVAHRLATVKDADKIIVMDEGKIVQSGNHLELLEQGGKYLELIQMAGMRR